MTLSECVRAAGELLPDLLQFVADAAEMGAAKSWREMGARSVLEARGLLKKMALETLGIAAQGRVNKIEITLPRRGT